MYNLVNDIEFETSGSVDKLSAMMKNLQEIRS